MLWIITEDKICSGGDDPTKVGRYSTHSAQRQTIMRAAEERDKPAILEGWKKQCNFEFRLFDDDGQHYYSGVCLDLDKMNGEGAFGPLDWAAAYAGCTRMDYRKKGEREWNIL